MVAQVNHVVHNLLELRVQSGLAVAREGDYVERFARLVHGGKLFAKLFAHLVARRHTRGALTLSIVAGFAVNAVERAYFAVVRHEVYTERNSQPTAVNGSEYCVVK